MIRRFTALFATLLLLLSTTACFEMPSDPAAPNVASLSELPAFSDSPYVVLNDNQPLFSEQEITAVAYEEYAPLDRLGRCGETTACIGTELMPTEERGAIGSVKPTGWQTAKYDFVDGKYLYNRCHLIGYQLTGENANECNLITGTRYMNTEGMLPFENMVADYIKETGNHVMYRVIPLFEGNNLLAHGVTMEAYSVEDQGEGICFYVYCYNVQPGVAIDYATGDNHEALDEFEGEGEYVLNVSSKKIHRTDCSAVTQMSEKNRQDYEGSLELLLAQGYKTCGECF